MSAVLRRSVASATERTKAAATAVAAIELAEASIKVHQSAEQHVANCSNAIIKLAVTPVAEAEDAHCPSGTGQSMAVQVQLMIALYVHLLK